MLKRGVDVLEFVSHSDGPVFIASIAEHLRLPETAVTRVVQTFVIKGLLKIDHETRNIQLTAAVLRYRLSFLRRLDVHSVAKAKMQALAEQLGTTVDLGIPVGPDMVIVQRVHASSASFVSPIEIGSRLDPCTSALGQAYLAMLHEEEQQDILGNYYASRGIAVVDGRERLKPALDQFQETGYVAIENVMNAPVFAVSAPFKGPKNEYYGLTCVGEKSALTAHRIAVDIAPALLGCARAIADEIGGNIFWGGRV